MTFPPSRPDDPAFFALLTGSFRCLVGRNLTGRDAAWLYNDAPYVVLAHDTQADPIFIYANKAAQDCFGYGAAEFLTLPSRLSAEATARETRQAALDAVARDGFVAGYGGIRIAKSGRRFRIRDAVIWQLIDTDGTVKGQAATFADWDPVG